MVGKKNIHSYIRITTIQLDATELKKKPLPEQKGTGLNPYNSKLYKKITFLTQQAFKTFGIRKGCAIEPV